jgi:hypothetical protein
VNEDGRCGPKRLYGFVNAWNPAVLVNARCNNDIKFLTYGSDTKNISFYITMYATKKQGKTYNLSAIMAEGLAYHLQHPNATYLDDLRKQQSQLLFRLGHAINRQQEVAMTMAITYLMGRSEVLRSHHYATIYWSTFVAHLLANEQSFTQTIVDEGYVHLFSHIHLQLTIKSRHEAAGRSTEQAEVMADGVNANTDDASKAPATQIEVGGCDVR